MKVSRGIAGVLLLVQVAACSKTFTVEEPVPFMRQTRPAQLWVTQAGGLESMLLAPMLVGDSVMGWDELGQQVVTPIAEIEVVRAREFDLTRTALLATGLAGIAVGLGFAIFGGYAECENWGVQSSNCPERVHEGPFAVDPQFRTAGTGLRISIP